MILALDIGNTCTVIGGFKNGELVFKAAIESARGKTEHEYAATLGSIIALHGIDKASIEGAIISSVVPKLSLTIKRALKLAFFVDALTVGPGVKTGLKLKCDDPASVGSDLVCAAVACKHLSPLPCLVIDMGTATKMIYINSDGDFEGVVIAPGMSISLDALIKQTSQLPEVSLEAPKKVIGKNTADSIRSGSVYATASMIDGMIERISKEAGEKLNIIGTGDQITLVAPYCNNDFLIDEDLILRGLYMIYNKNLKNK